MSKVRTSRRCGGSPLHALDQRFSKKVENHAHAVSLLFAHHDRAVPTRPARARDAARVAPAMAAQIETTHVRSPSSASCWRTEEVKAEVRIADPSFHGPEPAFRGSGVPAGPNGMGHVLCCHVLCFGDPPRAVQRGAGGGSGDRNVPVHADSEIPGKVRSRQGAPSGHLTKSCGSS